MCFQDLEALVRSFGNHKFSNWEPVVPRLGSIDSNGWEPLVLRTGGMCFQDCLGTSSSSNWEAVRHFFFEYLLLYVIGQYVWFNHAPSFCGRSLLAGLLRTHRWYRTNSEFFYRTCFSCRSNMQHLFSTSAFLDAGPLNKTMAAFFIQHLGLAHMRWVNITMHV